MFSVLSQYIIIIIINNKAKAKCQTFHEIDQIVILVDLN